MNCTRGKVTERARGVIILLATVLFGCAAGQVDRLSDSMEDILFAPEEHVRTALVQVLTEDGYSIRDGREQGHIISTGYREETNSIWDRLLIYVFGVNRSRVDATVTPESPDQTRLTIQVSYEIKNHIWSPWRDSSPALQQSAANQFRLVKNALGLL